MTELSLREAVTAVATQIEQTYEVRCTVIWNNSDANRLGFRLPGAHTVGFVLRTYYSDGDEFLTVIPLAKARIKDPAAWQSLLATVGKAWNAALQNEQERLRPEDVEPMKPGVKIITCPGCQGKILTALVEVSGMKACPDCGTLLPTAPSRAQKPGDGRNQEPRRNEEKRPD